MAIGLFFLLCVTGAVPCLAAADYPGGDAAGELVLALADHGDAAALPAVQAFPVGKRYVIGNVPLGFNRSQSFSSPSPTRVSMRSGRTNPPIGTKRWYPPSSRTRITPMPTLTMTPTTPTPTPTPITVPTPYAGPYLSPSVEIAPGLYGFSAAEVEAIRDATPHEWSEAIGRDSTGVWKSAVDPMRILEAFPTLHLSEGYVLRAYVFKDHLGGNSQVFVMPAESPFPEPVATVDYWGSPNGSGLPLGADKAIMNYIESDGSPLSYLEASIFDIEVNSFAEWWHLASWSTTTILDAKPDEDYVYSEAEPAIWSPTVRILADGAEVTLHTYGYTSASNGLYRRVVTYPTASYNGTVSGVRLAEVPVFIQF